MTRDDAIIHAGFRHAADGGWPGDCPEATEPDRLMWMEGFMAHHMRAADPTGEARERLAALRQRAMAELYGCIPTNDNATNEAKEPCHA